MARDEKTLEQLVRDVVPAAGAFRPCVMFDGPLDCIRVIGRDCSVTEIRVNEVLTVAQETYPSESGRCNYVGFTIKGAKHFCYENGLGESASVRIADVLDRIFSNFPEPAVRLAIDCVARPLIDGQPEIEYVHLDEAAVA